MFNKTRCVLAYGFPEGEIKKLKIYLSGVKIINDSMLDMKIKDIIDSDGAEDSMECIDKRIVIFNGYSNHDIRGAVKKLRSTFPGIILAVVTEVSAEWTVNVLIDHLMQERELEQGR